MAACCISKGNKMCWGGGGRWFGWKIRTVCKQSPRSDRLLFLCFHQRARIQTINSQSTSKLLLLVFVIFSLFFCVYSWRGCRVTSIKRSMLTELCAAGSQTQFGKCHGLTCASSCSQRGMSTGRTTQKKSCFPATFTTSIPKKFLLCVNKSHKHLFYSQEFQVPNWGDLQQSFTLNSKGISKSLTILYTFLLDIFSSGFEKSSQDFQFLQVSESSQVSTLRRFFLFMGQVVWLTGTKQRNLRGDTGEYFSMNASRNTQIFGAGLVTLWCSTLKP